MRATGTSEYCLPCEDLSHWIEILIRDEHNQPFENVAGVIIDATNKKHDVTLSEEPILLEDLPAGPVKLVLNAEEWVKEAQADPHAKNTKCDPVEEFAASYEGHEASTAQYFTVTTGDLTELPTTISLPERHIKGKADSVRFLTNKSYVLRVRAYNFITLRVGMFFDGTGNNTYSAQWGKKELDKYYSKWRNKYYVQANKKIPDWPSDMFTYPDDEKFHFFWEEDYAVDGSASNELTNIQKLHDLYLDDIYLPEINTFIQSEYITGIGTGNEVDNTKPADESVYIGQATGLGDYGVEAKVETGIQQLCRNIIKIQESDAYREYQFDGIRKVELDTFGFSRGAAAARHFANVVIDGQSGLFAKEFVKACKQNKISLINAFDWSENEFCHIKFIGLFDTVAAIFDPRKLDFTPHNDRNGSVRLWLDPERIERVVHITAHKKTEYRYNFCLNQINPADHFLEFVVPGAHSDLGGGYQSLQAYREISTNGKVDYLLPLLERKRIKRITERVGISGRDNTKKKVREKLEAVIEKEKLLGWQSSDFHIDDSKVVYRGRHDQAYVIGTLELKRRVEGDLSRLYLRVMYGFAEYAKVPVNDDDGLIWIEDGDSFYSVPNQVGGVPFASICKDALKKAKEGELLADLDVSEADIIVDSKMMNDFAKANLIHHSSDDSIANKPHKEGSTYIREVFACKKDS